MFSTQKGCTMALIMFPPLEWQYRGNFIIFSTLKGHSRGHFIVFSALKGHLMALCQVLFTSGLPFQTLYHVFLHWKSTLEGTFSHPRWGAGISCLIFQPK